MLFAAVHESACVLCAGFWTPECRDDRRAWAAGVQKAPRHEIAGRDTCCGAACAIENWAAHVILVSKLGDFHRLPASNACTTLALWHEAC